MKKYLSIAIMVIVAAGITLGFIMEDPHGSKTQSSSTSKTPTTINHLDSPTGTPVYTDDFDGANDTVALKLRGYKTYYRGTGPQGLTATWYQGSTPFVAYNGPSTGYVAANYNVVTGANNIDSWLVLPRLTGGIFAGDSLYFYERSVLGSTFPDSMRVMYSANDSIPEGTWVELGRFKTYTTTDTWERKGFRAPTASANGRFAIRYCVFNGGPSGANSDYMGVDALTIERTATGIIPISTETPSSYSVSQNYPNPFNPTTKINFALPKSGLVTLKVYDIVGKEVATLVNEVKNVGTYSVDLNGANLSSGMYFYKISVNGFSEVKKMSLIK